MGIGMALNLHKHLISTGLPPLRYSNRTLSRGDGLKEAGAIPEETFTHLIAHSSIIFTMASKYGRCVAFGMAGLTLVYRSPMIKC